MSFDGAHSLQITDYSEQTKAVNTWDEEMHNFRKLKIYEKALDFTRIVRMTTRSFPKDELFSLSAQFRRAADSIVLNIAEGAGNRSEKEFAKFLDYAIRSGHECLGCLDIALANKYISERTHSDLFELADEIVAMIMGFQRSLLK